MTGAIYSESLTQRIVAAIFCAFLCFLVALPVSAAAWELGATGGIRFAIIVCITMIGGVIGFGKRSTDS